MICEVPITQEICLLSQVCGIVSNQTFDSRLFSHFLQGFYYIKGWGHQEENTTLSTVLQQVQVPVIENKECRIRYQRIGQLRGNEQFSDRHVLCAGYTEGGMDACQGDSGGPLMLPIHRNGLFPFYQIGVISYGIHG